jgi:hypothetical protein
MSFSGCSWSDENIPPASVLASGRVTLSWNEAPGAISYNIYLSTSPGHTKLRGYKIRDAINPITITDLEPGTTYYFIVTMVNELGESEKSKKISHTVTDTDIVLITLGGNDFKNGLSKDITFRNLKKIVESIQKRGARVIIGGLKFADKDRGFGRGYEKIAEQTGAKLIPNIFEGIMGNRKLMSDPIHPNNAGYTIIAQRFYKAMSP